MVLTLESVSRDGAIGYVATQPTTSCRARAAEGASVYFARPGEDQLVEVFVADNITPAG